MINLWRLLVATWHHTPTRSDIRIKKNLKKKLKIIYNEPVNGSLYVLTPRNPYILLVFYILYIIPHFNNFYKFCLIFFLCTGIFWILKNFILNQTLLLVGEEQNMNFSYPKYIDVREFSSTEFFRMVIYKTRKTVATRPFFGSLCLYLVLACRLWKYFSSIFFLIFFG